MKHTTMFTAIITAAGLLCATAVNAQLLTGKVGAIKYFPQEKYQFQYGVKVQNQQNNYSFITMRSKSDGKKPENNTFILTNGSPDKYGFCTATNFLTVKVNGIESRKINLQTDAITPLSGDDFNGCSIKMNFDGCIVYLKPIMKKDSPFLYFTVEKDPQSPEELKSCEISLVCVVSGLMFKDKKVLFEKAYHKQAITAVRTIPQGNAKVNVTADDKYLILQDTVLDGTAVGKGNGPNVIWLGDFASVNSAKLHLRDLYETSFVITLKPDFKTFEFGVLQYPVRVTNDEMMKRLQAVPGFIKK